MLEGIGHVALNAFGKGPWAQASEYETAIVLLVPEGIRRGWYEPAIRLAQLGEERAVHGYLEGLFRG